MAENTTKPGAVPGITKH